MNPQPAKHLIIAGVTRAGTTSLFNYLADHPSVRGSTIKETRFFMDTDELKRLHRFEDGDAGYLKFFPDCPPGMVWLEATPDYVYRPAVAGRIAKSLSQPHIVLILREPIERLISWRKYAIQNGLLDPAVSLTDYIRTQFEAEAAGDDLPQHLRALHEGRYSDYLAPWIKAFAPDNLTVCNYRELLEDPAAVTRKVCDRAGLDAGYYDDYVFDIHNASRRVRWPRVQGAYRSLIWRIKPLVHDKPAVRSALRGVRRVTDTLLGRAGKQRAGDDPGGILTDADRRKLQAYYAQEPRALADALGLADWVW